MKRASGKSHCPINFGLEVFGDPWSLLVVRDIVYFGKRTFSEFAASDEKISPSVLSSRLDQLVRRGVLERRADPEDLRRSRYDLTPVGRGLIPVLLAIAQWGATVDPDTDAPPEWIAAVKDDPTAMVERITTTVADGGSIFVGDNSVVAQLGRGRV